MLFVIKKRKVINSLFFVICSILLLSGCSKDVPPTAAKGDAEFAVYLLKDQSLKFYNIYNKPVSSLELMPRPWLTSSDIRIYDFSSHCIYLKRNRAELFESRNGVPAPQMNSPFVVTVNGKAIYAGYFTAPASSYMAGAPSIDLSPIFYADDMISIISQNDETDIRNDERIKNVLSKAGIYQGGVKASISGLSVINNDTALVKYKLSLTNNCNYPVYVLDADKTGGELFHYFTNGPLFYNIQTKNTNWAQYKSYYTPTPYNLVLPEWFTLLKADETITREITLKGYSRFEKGDYEVSMRYQNPFIPKKEDRILNNNNIWLGSTTTNRVYFKLN